jgi:hypothetical protein
MIPRSAVVGLALLVACAPDAPLVDGETDAFVRDATSPSDLPASDVLLVHLRTEDLPRLPARDLDAEARREQLTQRIDALALVVDGLLATMPAGVEVVHTYASLPMLAVVVRDEDAQDALAMHPAVARLTEEPVEQLLDAASLDLIGQPAVAAAGFVGAGTSVAVLDTGAIYGRADFGNCTAVGTPASCRVVYAADFAAEDGQQDANGHGTNVGAIVANTAPGTDILALDVFTGGAGYGSDILAALDWVVVNQPTYAIAAVNMSLGSGRYTSACQNHYASAIATVRAAGVSVVVASGNDGYTDAIASPACHADALAVGAVYDAPRGPIGYSACSDMSPLADQVTCFSNSNAVLDILAPGALVTAGGYTMAGTSQAAPHVAGAMAVLRAAHPDASLDELEAMLVSSGEDILDGRNGLTFPRLDLEAALATAPAPGPGPDPDPGDDVPLTGTLVLDDGAPATRERRVTAAVDAPWAVQVCLANGDACTSWRDMAPTLSWNLPSAQGEHTVNAWFRDAVGTVAGPFSDAIVYDRRRPERGILVADPDDGTVDLTWADFADAASGVASYTVVMGERAAPSRCSSGTPVYTGPATDATAVGLVNGTTYGFSVCATDAAGNTSFPARALATPVPERDGPVGQVEIVGAPVFVRDTRVDLVLAATDAHDVTRMCLSNTTDCRRYLPYSTARRWALPRTDGAHTIRAWFEDEWGNRSATPATTTVVLDRVPPVDGAVVATSTPGAVALSWSGFSDSASSVVGYRVAEGRGARPPSNCSRGLVYTGDAVALDVPVAGPGPQSWRVCAVDEAGNVSSGATVVAEPAAETDPPVGVLILDDGAAWTRSTTVAATLSASDPSGVTRACLSTDTTCDRWFPYRTSRSVRLPSTTGDHTVRAWFEDAWGNVSEPVPAVIGLDRDRPVDGGVEASASSGLVELSWDGFEDAHAGIERYHVAMSTTGEAPRNCNRDVVWTGIETAVQFPDSVDGTTYTFRICAEDAVGNLSTGVVVTARPAPEYDAPEGSVMVGDGAAWVAERDVVVHLNATDASTVDAMCVSSGESCTRWEPYATTKALRLRPGAQTVRAWFRDAWGNVSEPVAVDVGLDRRPPADGPLTLEVIDGQLVVTWDDALDRESGVTGYTVHHGCDVAPQCDTAPAYTSPVPMTWMTSPMCTGREAIRVCAVDAVGHVSRGRLRRLAVP